MRSLEDIGPHLRLTSDGLHVEGSILWFDSKSSGDLSFLSNPSSKVSIPGPKIIATDVTLKILELHHQRPKALVCQYNRPFAIGKLKMELLPSGSSLGGASLHVDDGEGLNLLYAPRVLSQKNETALQMQLKPADTLILCAEHPDPASPMPNRRKEKDRLLNAVKAFVDQGINPTIICKAMPTAQEITWLLTDAQVNVAVHNSIFRINRIYEQFGSPLGQYSLLKQKMKRQRVLILPLQKKYRASFSFPDGPIFYVEDTRHDYLEPETAQNISDRFYISSTNDGRHLKDMVQMANPKEVYLFGPYTKRYVEFLKGSCPVVKPLYPNDQPTLF